MTLALIRRTLYVYAVMDTLMATLLFVAPVQTGSSRHSLTARRVNERSEKADRLAFRSCPTFSVTPHRAPLVLSSPWTRVLNPCYSPSRWCDSIAQEIETIGSVSRRLL